MTKCPKCLCKGFITMPGGHDKSCDCINKQHKDKKPK
jgi:hypothetical protein